MSKRSNSAKNPTSAKASWAGTGVARQNQNTPHQTSYAPSATPQSGNELKALLELLLQSLISAVSAKAGIILLYPSHGQGQRLICSIGLPGEPSAHEPFNLPCDTCGLTDLGCDIYSSNFSHCTKDDCPYSTSHFRSAIHTSLDLAPLTVNHMGKMSLFFSSPQQHGNHVSKTVMTFRNLIVAIVEHLKSGQEARRLDLIAERQAIANEIHDSLAQSLAYTRMRTSMLLESIRTGNELMSARYAHDIDETLERSQKTVRELITDFRCSMDPLGLLHALQNLIDQFRKQNDIKLEYINCLTHLELPLEFEIQVFHIAQEALSNIATHSGATQARLVVEFTNGNYLFTIEDNGSGGCTFTPVEGHYGMMIMRERAHRIGGEIKIISSQEAGTHVQLTFPQPGTNWRELNEQ